MLLGGLWHGASMSFIIWGAIHGVALAVHKFIMSRFSSFKQLGSEMKPWRRVLGIFITFHLVCFGWIFFRADSLQTVKEMLSQICTNFHPGGVCAICYRLQRRFYIDDNRLCIAFYA